MDRTTARTEALELMRSVNLALRYNEFIPGSKAHKTRNTNKMAGAQEFLYFMQFVRQAVLHRDNNVVLCILTLSNHVAKLTQIVLGNMHDLDCVMYTAGEVFFYIFWLAHILDYNPLEVVPRRRQISGRKNRITLGMELADAHKKLMKGCAAFITSLWKNTDEDDNMKTCLMEISQEILNVTEATDIHHVLENALQHAHVVKLLEERTLQAHARKRAAYEIESNKVLPLMYKAPDSPAYNIAGGHFQSVLNHCFDIGEIRTLTLRQMACKLQIYLLQLRTKGYSHESIMNATVSILDSPWCTIDVRDIRTLLYPLSRKMKPITYVQHWNLRHPNKPRMYTLDPPDIKPPTPGTDGPAILPFGKNIGRLVNFEDLLEKELIDISEPEITVTLPEEIECILGCDKIPLLSNLDD